MFIKIKGISPLKGINKWALEGALNGGALSTALQSHVYGQTRAIILTSDLRPGGIMVLRPRGFSQIYVRIGLEEQSRQKTKQGRQESKAGAKEAKCGANVW